MMHSHRMFKDALARGNQWGICPRPTRTQVAPTRKTLALVWTKTPTFSMLRALLGEGGGGCVAKVSGLEVLMRSGKMLVIGKRYTGELDPAGRSSHCSSCFRLLPSELSSPS